LPVRTYTNVDFGNYSLTEQSNTGSNPATVNTPSQFNVELLANGSDSFPADGAIVSDVGAVYWIGGTLDFDVFPAIPDNAQITKVEIQIDVEVNGDADATVVNVGGGDNVFAQVFGTINTFVDAGVLPDIEFTHIDTDDAPGELEAHATLDFAYHYTATQIFNYEGSPITKAELITLFTNWLVTMQMTASAQSTATP